MFQCGKSDISIEFVAREDLFKPSTLSNFVNYLEILIDQVLLDSKSQLSDLCIVNGTEYDMLVKDFNNTHVDYDLENTFINRFTAQSLQCPDNAALIFGEERVSYQVLNQQSDLWASNLVDLGLKPDSIVGLSMSPSTELITTILAIMKAGAAYVYIDPEYPTSRARHILEECNCSILISNQDVSFDEIPEGCFGLGIDVLDQKTKNGKKVELLGVSPDSTAYVMFTSGSTGQPKGVKISHRSLTDYSLTFKEYFALSSSDRIIQQASPSFDTFVEEVFPALLSGAAVIIPEKGRGIESLVQSIKEKQATVLSTVPLILNELNDYVEDIKSLRVIISGGDLLLPKHIRNLFGNFSLYNTYGPTESTVCITYHQIKSLEDASCIGSPIPNREVYILDSSRQICPVGVAGELCVSGNGLAQEYLNDASKTLEKFIKNPFKQNSRIYLTGDLAKWNSDGTIQYLGRIDQQLKHNGVRIEPGEIESHMCDLSGIKESAVIVREVSGKASLVCYYVSDQAYTIEGLQSYLSGHLPVTMIPRYYVELPAMPITSTGKLDRKSLPEVVREEVEYVAAETELERHLLELWSEILGRKESEMGINHNFFEVGGNSLKAMVLINRINKAFSVQLLLRDIFQYQTIDSLANYINGKEKQTFISIPKAENQVSYPLSSAQQRMYFLYEFDKASTTYNMPGVFELRGRFDISQLELVFSQLIDRHESLRTVFKLGSTGAEQLLLEDYKFSLSSISVDELELEAAISEFVRPFDLANELPIRIELIKVSNGLNLLLVDMHHIISDGVSMDILLADFWSLYQGNKLELLPLQYSDYAVWQQSEDYQTLVNESKQYWVDLYESEVSELLLPFDHPRPLYRNNSGIAHQSSLNVSQVEGLRKLSQELGITLSTLFLSLFKVLLHKLSGSEDIVVGTATAGRHHADLEGMVGMFVNTLALRDKIESTNSFKSIASKVHQTSLSALEHQLYQYEDLIDLLGLERDTSRNPLFDVFYLYQEQRSGSSFNTSELTIHPFDEHNRVQSKFDLSMNVSVSESDISIGFVARKDLFESSSLVRFMTYLDKLIDQVLLDAGQELSQISVLSERECTKLLNTFNDTVVEYDEQATVLDLFRSQVNKNPEAVAIIHNGESLSYGELDARSDKWSSYLSSKGISKGSIVGLLMSRSSEMITGILSLFKLGCAYLPIDPDQPTPRSLHMLSEMSSMDDNRLVLSNLSSVPEQIINNYQVLAIGELDNYDGKLLTLEYPTPPDLAYIIYTSGSTGQPKGVLVEHEGITNLIQSQLSYFGITSDEKILQSSRYHFDPSVEQIWLALTSGSSLVLVDDETLSDAAVFNRFLETECITHLHNTPSFLGRMKLSSGLSLRRVIAGGEACSISLAKHISSLYPFYNKYGLTEGTVTSTIHPVDFHGLSESMTSLPIGRPIGNTQVYILDPNLNLVGEGIIGELYIGGKGLSRGYLNREDLTAARFIANPYGAGKLYRTGDLGKWNSDGTIQYLGRADQQLKYNGVRIEPGEIEEHMCGLSGIKESAVTVKKVSGKVSLVCYYVSDQLYTVEDLQSHLSEYLPVAMIPRYYIGLSAMPTTSTGKLDRKSLPEVVKEKVEYISAETVLERQLLKLWSEVLGMEESEIGISHNFFELGGNSLKAMVLINRINKAFSVQLLLRDIFQYQTIGSLAIYINGKERQTFVSIPKAEKQVSYPLSSAQQRMYFLYEFDKSSTTYNMPGVFELRGGIDISQLELVFSKLIDHHESLRTVFKLGNTGVEQRVLEDYKFSLSSISVDESEVEAAISEFVRPFDLSSELPIRIELLKVSNGLNLLLVDMHHIISDGVSMEVLSTDFAKLYQREELPPLRIQYTDYAVWQSSDIHKEQLEKERLYWERQFEEEITILNLPYDRQRPKVRNSKGEYVTFKLTEKQLSGLRSISLDNESTMFMVMLSLFKLLLSKLSNQYDIIVGTPISGRNHLDLEGIVGMFVNTLAIRTSPKGEKSYRDYLQEVKDSVIGAFEHQNYQFEDLIDHLSIERDTSRNPLFDVMFSYNTEKSIDSEETKNFIRPFETVIKTDSKFDLTMQVIEEENEANLAINYAVSLFDRQSIEKIFIYFDRIINTIIEDPNVVLGSISLLSNQEKEEQLMLSSGVTIPYDSDLTVLDLFKEKVSEAPDAIAIFSGNEEIITYEELDNLSDHLAGYLIKERARSARKLYRSPTTKRKRFDYWDACNS